MEEPSERSPRNMKFLNMPSTPVNSVERIPLKDKPLASGNAKPVLELSPEELGPLPLICLRQIFKLSKESKGRTQTIKSKYFIYFIFHNF